MSGLVLAVAAVAGVGLAGWRWAVLIRAVAIPRDRRLLYALFLLGAALGLMALWNEPGWLGGTLAVLAVTVGTAFPALRLRSAQRPNRPAAVVGEPMPAFRGVDDVEAPFDSVVLAGKPYLMKFFRGHW